jgi:hypothetical protein
MRCEQCGRALKNAQMWRLSGDQSAPMSRSMRLLCWDCRESDGDLKPAHQDESNSILAQAYAIVQEVESRGF